MKLEREYVYYPEVHTACVFQLKSGERNGLSIKHLQSVIYFEEKMRF